MIYKQISLAALPATVLLGQFATANGVSEFHATIELTELCGDTPTQYRLLDQAVQQLHAIPELTQATLIWKRFFVSDAINQASYLNSTTAEAISIVQQPPLNRSKASLLLYFVDNTNLSTNGNGSYIMERPAHNHLFDVQQHARNGNSEQQTRDVFDNYSQQLSRSGSTLAANCVRTWIFVQDVDVQYAGMVAARKDYFEREGLTNETHYIASTGIEGRYIYPEVLMLMDAYAVTNLDPQQIGYLKAPTHLNPTHEYGVTFERGTTIDYADRRHIFISGTASINNRGQIVHPLNIEQQTARTFENIQVLLAEADATMHNVAHMIVYLRDTADYAAVKLYVEQHFGTIPHLMVWAPVCRPGWLVEVECMAVKNANNKQLGAF